MNWKQPHPYQYDPNGSLKSERAECFCGLPKDSDLHIPVPPETSGYMSTGGNGETCCPDYNGTLPCKGCGSTVEDYLERREVKVREGFLKVSSTLSEEWEKEFLTDLFVEVEPAAGEFEYEGKWYCTVFGVDTVDAIISRISTLLSSQRLSLIEKVKDQIPLYPHKPNSIFSKGYFSAINDVLKLFEEEK